MFFGDEDNPAMWFAEFQWVLPLTWTETQKVAHFGNHIVHNSDASDWFDALTPNETATLTTLHAAFNVRWPPPEYPQFSRAEQTERIREQVLKEENIGKWITPSDKWKADYSQNLWAGEVVEAAVSMGDTAGFLIDCVVDGIPNLLKDHLECRYSTWEEFKKDVRSVPPHKIKRGKEKLERERARDAEIAQLRAQTMAAATTLQTTTAQLPHLHLSPRSYNAHPQAPYRPPPGPAFNYFNSPTQQPPPSLVPHPGWSTTQQAAWLFSHWR